MEVARGAVRDQPWGLTLGAIAQRATTGELTIVEGATRIVLVLEDGFLVAGTSTRSAPTLLERAARSFDLPNATYVIDDRVTLIRREQGAAVDLREVIFTGARRYLEDERLHAQLRHLGTRFSLGPGGAAELPRYGSDAPVSIAPTLREGASLAELEATHADVDRRALLALVYALVSCGAVRGLLPARAPTPPPAAARTITPNRATPVPPETQPRAPTPNQPRAVTPNQPRASSPNPNDSGQVPLARIPTLNVARNPTPPGTPRTPTPPRTSTTKDVPQAPRTTPARDAPQVPRTATTKDALPPLDDDFDVPVVRTTTTRDPAVPGDLENESRTATIRDAAPPGARELPGRSASPPAAAPPAARPARAGTSRDPAERPAPLASRSAGNPARATPSHGVRIIAPDDEATQRASQAADRARRLLEAHEYVEAQREALSATRLSPDSFDYQALHAWATFCGSRDKPAVAEATRKLLEKASHRASAPHDVRMMLGKLERTVGREREALRHFRAVLERDPAHAEAAGLIRELEAQLEAFARR